MHRVQVREGNEQCGSDGRMYRNTSHSKANATPKGTCSKSCLRYRKHGGEPNRPLLTNAHEFNCIASSTRGVMVEHTCSGVDIYLNTTPTSGVLRPHCSSLGRAVTRPTRCSGCHVSGKTRSHPPRSQPGASSLLTPAVPANRFTMSWMVCTAHACPSGMPGCSEAFSMLEAMSVVKACLLYTSPSPRD